MKAKSIIIIVSLVIAAMIFLRYAFVTTGDAKNLCLNIFSSSFVVLLIEVIALIRDVLKYSFLKGTYRRTGIFGEDLKKTSDTKYVSMNETYLTHKVSPTVTLKYLGDGKYRGTAYYDEGETKITLNLDLDNRMTGKGTYQYVNKSYPDLGIYEFQVDELCRKTIYIRYSNFLPSGLARGYEIWKKGGS